MVIAIDGPAGAGKSTVARALARELGFTYLDSGAMYRCVALLALAPPRARPAELARGAAIEPGRDGARVLLDGRDVTRAIRAPEVSRGCLAARGRPGGARALLVPSSASCSRSGDWVAEGRDIGTVVAPDAAS